MAEPGPAQHLRTYGQIAWLWIRAAWQYPTSFVLLAVGNGLITGLDFVGSVDHVRPPRRPQGLLAPRGGPALRQRVARPRDRRHRHRQRGADRHLHPHRPAGPDDDQAGAAAGAGVRRPVHPAPARPAHPGGRRVRLGLHVRRLDAAAGPGGRVDARQRRAGVLRPLRRLLLHPVLDDGRDRVRQRLHLRRRDGHPVPAQHLPARGDGRADLRHPGRLRQLVPLPLPAGPQRPLRHARTRSSSPPRSPGC